LEIAAIAVNKKKGEAIQCETPKISPKSVLKKQTNPSNVATSNKRAAGNSLESLLESA
jgi:hypothetical protein